MGFKRENAERTLQLTNYNLDTAIDLLITEKGIEDNADENAKKDKPVSLNKQPVSADNQEKLDQIKVEPEP